MARYLRQSKLEELPELRGRWHLLDLEESGWRCQAGGARDSKRSDIWGWVNTYYYHIWGMNIHVPGIMIDMGVSENRLNP